MTSLSTVKLILASLYRSKSKQISKIYKTMMKFSKQDYFKPTERNIKKKNSAMLGIQLEHKYWLHMSVTLSIESFTQPTNIITYYS